VRRAAGCCGEAVRRGLRFCV